MSSPPVARSPSHRYQNQGGATNGGGMSYSNSKPQLTTDNVDNPANGFAPNNKGHDYDALLRGATIAPVAVHNNPINDNDASEINNGMASSTTATTTPTSMTANSANHMLRTSPSYMGDASGSGSSSGETTTSSISASVAAPAAAAPPAIAITMTIGGSSGVSEVKLRRFLEHNQRLREQLEMRRIPVSEASQSLIQYVTSTQDGLLPSLWGTTGTDPFAKPSSGCCTIG